MGEFQNLEGPLFQALEMIDESLAERNVQLWQRPTSAAMGYVSFFVLAVGADDGVVEPSESNDFLSQPWFRDLYSAVEGWYWKRYGSALSRQPSMKL